MPKQVQSNRQSNEVVNKYLEEVGADGHSILKPEYLINIGFTFDFVAKYAYRQKAGKGKERLYDDTGKSVAYMDGVYALDFLYGIAENVGADTSEARSKMGRGFQAQELCRAIRAILPQA